MTDQADDIDVIKGALAWLQAGHQVAIATVVKTWGSSPRPPGSMMTMNHLGQYLGSVSGGCIEESLLSQYRKGELEGPNPTLLSFGVDRQEASRLGLPCGGRLEILIEYLSETRLLQDLLAQLNTGKLISRCVNINNGEVTLVDSEATPEFQCTATQLTKTFGPAWQLLLIGNGQLAQHLASMALHLDYRVTICDPREEFTPLMPLSHVLYSKVMPDDAVHAIPEQHRIAIVTLAHDPRQDDLGICAALESQAFYIGALGSKRSAQARKSRLMSMGYTQQQIARIHGPVGLDIGSKRPAEIAVSILAHITAVRNGMAHIKNA